MTLDATGLTIKTASEIEAEIKVSLRAALGDQLQIGPESPLGQLISIIATLLGGEQALSQALYEAFDPDAAVGQQLDAVIASNGLTRNPATKSTVTLTILGANGTVIPIGYTVRIPDGAAWDTTAGGTIAGGTLDLLTEAQDTGAIEGLAGTINDPVVIIAGVTSVSNTLAADIGRAIETDAQVRQRRAGSFALIGAGTDASMRSALGEIDSVTDALVISNRTDLTDAFGIPSREFRAVVWPVQTDHQTILTTIWEDQPSGIKADGAITGTAVDDQGVSQPVAYQLADEQQVHVDVILTSDPLAYPGDATVKAAVVTYGAEQTISQSLLLHKIESAIDDAAAGILTIEVRAKIGSAPGAPDVANIDIDLDQIITIDLSNVDVNGV